MNLFFLEEPVQVNQTCLLNADDSRHLVKVLRAKKGDTVFCTSGNGELNRSVLVEANPKKASLLIEEIESQQTPNFPFFHIAIAPTKNLDRIETFIEKAVEVGVSSIRFFESAHSERKVLKMDRVKRIAVSALKQSLKFNLPALMEIDSFGNLVKQFTHETELQKFIAYVPEKTSQHLFTICKKGMPAVVLIGPEGGFSSSEVDFAKKNGFTSVSLGESRLRTETAGIIACHTLHLVQLKND